MIAQAVLALLRGCAMAVTLLAVFYGLWVATP